MSILISQFIKELPEENFPEELHEKILDDVRLHKLKVKFGLVISFLAINFFISLWVIFTKIEDSNIVNVFQYLLDGFEMNTSYLSDVFNTFTQFFPIEYMIMFIINLFVMGYLINASLKFKKILLHSH